MQPTYKPVAVLDLLLYRDNPRHVSKSNQADVIEYLLSDEEVFNLARHMSQHGINPLEVIAVFPDDDGNLVVAEGNRRICAAQLLTDPEKAPENARSRFRNLASKSRDVSEAIVAQFDSYATAHPWLQVLHDGEQDGVGRRRWKPEQKARATTSKSTDALAVALLDYAELDGIIDAASRKGIQVSTATRYLANPNVRHAMGIASSATSDELLITIDSQKFHDILANFVAGIFSKKLHSRSVTKDWLAYAAELEASFGKSPAGPATAPSRRPVTGAKTQARPTRAKIVAPDTSRIARSATLIAGLNKLGSFKLCSLYESLTSIRLDDHPGLMTTGAWAFVETFTAIHGRTTGDFVSYLNSEMAKWHWPREDTKECRLSLDHISHHGNAQKHSATFSVVDARNLYNHFNVLDKVFVRLANECVARGNP